MMNSTKQRRELTGSPLFNYEVPELTAGAVHVIELAPDTSSAARYAPFDFLQVSNGSAHALEVDVNEAGNILYVAASTIQSADKTTAPAIWSLRLENVGTGTIAAGEVRVVVQKTVADSETFVQKIVRRFVQPRGLI
jgi:hypothetical protein